MEKLIKSENGQWSLEKVEVTVDELLKAKGDWAPVVGAGLGIAAATGLGHQYIAQQKDANVQAQTKQDQVKNQQNQEAALHQHILSQVGKGIDPSKMSALHQQAEKAYQMGFQGGQQPKNFVHPIEYKAWQQGQQHRNIHAQQQKSANPYGYNMPNLAPNVYNNIPEPTVVPATLDQPMKVN